MKTIENLQAEKFNEIYTNEELRNAVAFAHGCNDKYGKHLHYKALMCPVEYIVTEKQIQEAKNEYERAKKEKVKNLKAGQLIFVGMGSSFAPRFDGDLCNHRIRTEFKNKEGRRFFIEVGTGKYGYMRCDHSVDRDMEYQYNDNFRDLSEKMKPVKKYSLEWQLLHEDRKKWLKQPYYNYAWLEHKDLGKYTKENLLKIINETFGCSYTSIEVDNHTLRTEDFICHC